MSRTYKATGINLKSMPLGEADRLLTILTREFGLIRAVAPGARKHHSKLSGRSGLFVVNELLIAKGRSLDKITQAETKESYPALSKDLGKLAASQYLAEMVLCQALSEQPQEELFDVLNEHLRRLEELPRTTLNSTPASSVLAYLSHGVFHLLALAGIAPQVHACCLTQHPLIPNFIDPDWRVGFSLEAGGTVSLLVKESEIHPGVRVKGLHSPTGGSYQTNVPTKTPLKVDTKLNAVELALLQQLAGAELTQLDRVLTDSEGDLSQHQSVDTAWLSVERILRQYTHYHLGHSIRSAALMDACFS
jgi:DNA repair protein RecO (recombination protein O)